MKKAEPLFPDEMPQCQAMRVNVYANDTPDTDRRCTKAARYRVMDKCYCLRHAEIAALNILLKQERENEQS